MRKRIISVVLLLLMSSLLLCGYDFSKEAKAGVYVYDSAGLINTDFENELSRKIANARDEMKSDVLVVFIDDAGVTNARTASENIAFDWINKGGGYGDDHHIVTLLVNMADRSYFVNEHSDSGNDYRLKDSEIVSINEDLQDALSRESYDGAALKFVEHVERKLKPGFFQRFYSWILMGVLGGGAAMGIAKGSHNARNTGVRTAHYRKGELRLKASNDMYTRTTTSVRQIETQKSGDSEGPLAAGEGSEGNHGAGGHF